MPVDSLSVSFIPVEIFFIQTSSPQTKGGKIRKDRDSCVYSEYRLGYRALTR
ncbi:uncharacterized protein PgNI_03308 [Pyricularia grisea]|uniref:Uncharacterized protein n=1 Tax=Pyricularia grisea TaxID=148305 RepID=A0A6P8BDF0_PYRGI|nr:uncharacterized protein PgNI_03308 [Pyricularia grisea]TLD13789.1 hypothetical protein PgNI_03308 [Pyricularia grisea]